MLWPETSLQTQLHMCSAKSNYCHLLSAPLLLWAYCRSLKLILHVGLSPHREPTKWHEYLLNLLFKVYLIVSCCHEERREPVGSSERVRDIPTAL